MKKITVIFLCIIILCTFCLSSCGQNDIQDEHASGHIHSYTDYGYCPECGEIKQETLEELDKLSIEINQSFWKETYKGSRWENQPEKFDIHREKISFSDDSYNAEGYVLIALENGERYRSRYTIKFEWDGEKFVKKGGSPSMYCCADESGNILSNYTLDGIFRTEGNAKEFVFESNNEFSWSSNLIYDGSTTKLYYNTSHGTYTVTRNPTYYEISLTFDSGSMGFLQAYNLSQNEEIEIVEWGSDIYFTASH